LEKLFIWPQNAAGVTAFLQFLKKRRDCVASANIAAAALDEIIAEQSQREGMVVKVPGGLLEFFLASADPEMAQIKAAGFRRQVARSMARTPALP
jgi:hypothetical protein